MASTLQKLTQFGLTDEERGRLGFDENGFEAGVLLDAGVLVTREQLAKLSVAEMEYAMVWADSTQQGTPIRRPEWIATIDVDAPMRGEE